MADDEVVVIKISEIYASDFYEWSQTDCESNNYGAYENVPDHDFESCKQLCREVRILKKKLVCNPPDDMAILVELRLFSLNSLYSK